VAGAKEGEPFLDEFRNAGFASAEIIRTTRNARTNNPKALAVDIIAYR
jgi:hypothetical protein